MTHSGTFVVQRSVEDVYELLADPQRFGPLMPDFESMAMQDSSHFTLRTKIAVGELPGQVNLAMEVSDSLRPSHVKYRGEGVIAGSQLRFAIEFGIGTIEGMTEVRWTGEVSLDGMLAMMAGNLIETKGRENFERMAERVRQLISCGPGTVESQDEDPEAPPLATADN